jgi:hypothetical protein
VVPKGPEVVSKGSELKNNALQKYKGYRIYNRKSEYTEGFPMFFVILS